MKRRRRQGNPIKFSERMAAALPTAPYSALDRYRDFRRLFETDQGQRVLAQIMSRCQVWERSYAEGDTHETARREGMRDVGLWIMEIMNTEPAPTNRNEE